MTIVRLTPQTTKEELLAMTDNDRTIATLEDPAEREWLTNLAPETIRDNAHRIYELMEENGIPVDSWTRELAFTKASEHLKIDYNVLYDAWIDGAGR